MSGVLTNALDEPTEEALPAIPPGLTKRQIEALTDLEVLSDDDLKELLLKEWAGDSCDDPDLLMLRRAYAGALLRWRGRQVELDELSRACPFT